MLWSAVLTSAVALLPITAMAESITLPDVLYNGPITPEGTSSPGHLDWPKLHPSVNESSYDWWYFDIVSADGKASATVVFYNSGPAGFINTFDGGPLSASLTGVLHDGTVYRIEAPATSAVISREEDGNNSFAISAVYTDSGFSFKGTSLSHHGKVKYVVTVDAPHLGITGSLTLTSSAPAHYPCGPADAKHGSRSQTELLFPHVYWSNAVPDAVGEVDLLINGTASKYVGAGYHDKNWGDTPFATTTKFWYWGHAHLGPYSVVWFDAVDAAGVEHFSGYVAKDGRVLLASCAVNSTTVRPWGANSQYPPKIGTGVMEGLEVRFDLGRGETFVANVTTKAVAVNLGPYVRTTGTVTGGVLGCGKTYEGATLFEEFKFAP